MEPKSNIIVFPTNHTNKNGVVAPPDFRDRQTREFIAMFLQEFNNELITNIALNGFDVDHPSYVTNMAVITKLIEVALHQCSNVPHVLDDVLDAIVDAFERNAKETEEEPTEDK